MPTARRSRRFSATVEDVWATVGDPHHLPRWWPRVQRVEQVDAGGFTEVLQTDSGKSVRADFRLTALEAPREIRWTQDIEGTPFERILAAADVAVRLTADGDATRVELELRQKLRGFARFGGFMVRGASRRALDDALDGLGRLFDAPA
jgi:uncharacterized protein YndB with AHSA1/START domain